MQTCVSAIKALPDRLFVLVVSLTNSPEERIRGDKDSQTAKVVIFISLFLAGIAMGPAYAVLQLILRMKYSALVNGVFAVLCFASLVHLLRTKSPALGRMVLIYAVPFLALGSQWASGSALGVGAPFTYAVLGPQLGLISGASLRHPLIAHLGGMGMFLLLAVLELCYGAGWYSPSPFVLTREWQISMLFLNILLSRCGGACGHGCTGGFRPPPPRCLLLRSVELSQSGMRSGSCGLFQTLTSWPSCFLCAGFLGS